MVVEIQSKERGEIGLRVGRKNVRRYFSSKPPAIDLELDHLQIQCELNPDFWRDRPEINDPRLSSWLRAKYPRGRQRGVMALNLVPAGEKLFRLELTHSSQTADPVSPPVQAARRIRGQGASQGTQGAMRVSQY